MNEPFHSRTAEHSRRYGRLIFVRHGESVWNRENRFAGWIDVDLSPRGIDQARAVGGRLLADGLTFDFAFTSILRRSVDTLAHIQDVMHLKQVPVVSSWRLNERHYGALSGHDKAEMAKLYGAERLARWRRGYDVRPPPAPDELQHRLLGDTRYAVEAHEPVPATESLKDTLERAVPFWTGHIRPLILRGETVLVSGHGNWIRMLIKHLDDVAEDRLAGIEVGNAEPIVYDFDMREAALGDWRL